jgi:hypothetical protein
MGRGDDTGKGSRPDPYLGGDGTNASITEEIIKNLGV